MRDFRSLLNALGRPLPWFLAGCAVFLYLHLFMLPWTPVAAGGGQNVYLVGGMRMLDGQTVYRDFFDFTAPGTDVVYFALFRIFGVRAWIPNVMVIVLGLGLAWLSVVIAGNLMRGASVFLPALVFLTFSYRFRFDATHHWYSALAVLAALAVVMEVRSPARLMAAGAFCGLASFLTQTRGLMAVLGLATFPTHRLCPVSMGVLQVWQDWPTLPNTVGPLGTGLHRGIVSIAGDRAGPDSPASVCRLLSGPDPARRLAGIPPVVSSISATSPLGPPL